MPSHQPIKKKTFDQLNFQQLKEFEKNAVRGLLTMHSSLDRPSSHCSVIPNNQPSSSDDENKSLMTSDDENKSVMSVEDEKKIDITVVNFFDDKLYCSEKTMRVICKWLKDWHVRFVTLKYNCLAYVIFTEVKYQKKSGEYSHMTFVVTDKEISMIPCHIDLYFEIQILLKKKLQKNILTHCGNLYQYSVTNKYVIAVTTHLGLECFLKKYLSYSTKIVRSICSALMASGSSYDDIVHINNYIIKQQSKTTKQSQ